MQKINFSVVLIARNESKTLPRLVNSLKEFQERGGEIVLLDTGSTDDTANIARGLGCKVEEVGNRFQIEIDEDLAKNINDKFVVEDESPIVKAGDKMFDYSSARNYASTLSSNEMIATPDCDEIYTKFDIDQLINLIAAGADQFEYDFVFSHDDEGAELIKFSHCKFYNRTKMKWVGVIHEVLQHEPSIEIKNLKLDDSIIKLEHYQNVETNRSHYLKGLAYDCYLNPDNDRNAHYLGRELFYTFRPKSAIIQLERHIAMRKWPTEAGQSKLYIGDCYMQMGNPQEAISNYAAAFDFDTNRREPFMKIAEYYYQLRKPDQVLAYAAAALQVKGESFYSNFQPYYEHLPHEMLYWALWEKGEKEASRQHFDVCMGYQPHSSKYLNDYQFYYKIPKVSCIILNRTGSTRCEDSLKEISYPTEYLEYSKSESGISDANAIKQLVDSCTGNWIIVTRDDVAFEKDSIIHAIMQANNNGKLYMQFNTGDDLVPVFMINKRAIRYLGNEILDTDFTTSTAYKLLFAKIEKLGHMMTCSRAKVSVLSPSLAIEAESELLSEKLTKLYSGESAESKFNG